MRVFIREQKPPATIPCVNCKKGEFFVDFFYDDKKKILFRVMKEPSFIKLRKDVSYDFTFSDSNDTDTYTYRLYKRLNADTVIVAQHYNNGFIKEDIKYIACAVKHIFVEDYKLPENGLKTADRTESEAEIFESFDEGW